MRHLAVVSTLSAVVLAGCAGDPQPKLAHADAAQLTALTDRISREDACAQTRDIAALSARAVQLVNRGRVPAALQEPLLAGVNALAARSPRCVQTVPATIPLVPVKPGHQPHDHHGGKHGHGD